MIHALCDWSTITQRQTARLPHFELGDLDQSLCLSVYRQNASFLGITGEWGSDCASCSGGFSKRERSGCSARLLIVVLHVSAPPLCLIIDSSRGRLKRQRNTAQTLLKLLGDARAALRRGFSRLEQARIDLKAMQSGNFKGQRFHGRTPPPLIDAARVISGRAWRSPTPTRQPRTSGTGTAGEWSVTERCNRLALLVTSPLILADRCEECSRLVGKSHRLILLP